MSKGLICIIGLATALGACMQSVMADETVTEHPERRKFGISTALAIVPFVGGDSGPVTPISETRYEDTFDSVLAGALSSFATGQPAGEG
jgi:hypothetical protein